MLCVVEATLSLALALPIRWRIFEDTVIQIDSNSTKDLILASTAQGKPPEVMISGSLDEALAEDFSSVRQVRNVLIESVHDSVLVWIVVDNPERAVRNRIFQKELDLMDAFPEINFDFNVIPALGRNVEEIATGVRVAYTRN
jgi:hypothetical protein